MNSQTTPTVLFPSEWMEAQPRVSGPLFGYAHEGTGVYNLLACGAPPSRPPMIRPPVELGTLAPGDQQVSPVEHGRLVGRYTHDGIQFTVGTANCRAQSYSLTQDVFSRNTGILESSRLLGCCAIISGCGSVGSQLALDLARSGVGRFVLVDNDVLAYHNICRHQCGITDVGRWKVEALRDRILEIHPQARILTLNSTLQMVPPAVFQEWCDDRSIIVGCADNREGDVYANQISCIARIPFLSIGLWERAFAGELFWSLPGSTPCYYCVFGGAEHALSGRVSANRQHYIGELNPAEVQFEPGIAVDIGFVTTIGSKIALDLLSFGNPAEYQPRLLRDLRQFTLVCNTNSRSIGGERSELFDHALQITRSIEVRRRDDCPHCRLVTI